MTTTKTNYGTLYDYRTGESIRPATRAEWRASRAAEKSNMGGGAGVILIDERGEICAEGTGRARPVYVS